MKINVKKFRENTIIPIRMSDGANGYDVFLPEPVVIPPSKVVAGKEVMRHFLKYWEEREITDNVHQQYEELLQCENKMLVDIGRLVVPTGVGVELPRGLDCSTRGRSGCAFGKKDSVFAFGGMDAYLGTIDMDYRGEIHLLLFNFSPFPLPIEAGERVGQLIFTRIETPELILVDDFEDQTERGDKGFGSTDNK